MSHPDIKTIKAQIFWEDFYQKSVRKEIPFIATLELTHRCNLFCRHCYIPQAGESHTKDQRRDEFSFSEVCSILDQLVDLGCFHLNITGGEPLARPDIIKILTYAKRKGFYIVLFTNATLMTPYLAEELRELNINEMEISLYGMTLKTYEEITQVPGSFDRCIEGIQLLCQMDINISLKMMVLTYNLAEFDRIKSFAEKLEVPFLWNYQVDPRIDGSGEPLKYRISSETAVDLELRVKSHLSEEKKNTRKKQNLSSKKNAFFHCDAGKNSITISPYGEIILCLGYRFPQYDLRRGSVAEGWRELVKYVKSIKPDSSYQCGECEFENDCLWCPSDGWLNKKDGNVCNPYYRELAELRRGKERGWIA